MKTGYLFPFAALLAFFACEAQSDPARQIPTSVPRQETVTSEIPKDGPQTITRSILRDREGNLWLAAFDGLFRYDGTSYTNVLKDTTDSRFFSILQDRSGDLWFGTVGGGVYRYDGTKFERYGIEDGLVSNEVLSIFEDRGGNLWFGGNGGVSRYDGKSFRNYVSDGKSMFEDKTGKLRPGLNADGTAKRPGDEVNVIVQDNNGTYWLGTRGDTYTYDGTSFQKVMHDELPFGNVRSIATDHSGTLWIGGPRGLWTYDGENFTQHNQDFTGYIYVDRYGNVWTASQLVNGNRWALSRIATATSPTGVPPLTVVEDGLPDNSGMLFGISEATDGTIWVGSLRGVRRYDPVTLKSTYRVENHLPAILEPKR